MNFAHGKFVNVNKVIFLRKPLRMKSRDVMMSNLKLDLARSLELIRFCFNITSINILNFILQDFLVIIIISRIFYAVDKVFGLSFR